MSRRRRSCARAGAALAAVLLVLGAAAVASLVAPDTPPARAATSGQLQQQISSGRQKVSRLSGTVASDTRRVDQLSGSISALAAKLGALQADLDAKRAQLISLRAQLTAAQARLARLEATEALDEQVLAQQLVGSYEGGQPNIVDVVLSSTGFNDLLERLDFVQRIGHHDAQITAAVKGARRAVAAEAVKLGALSARQQRLTDQVLQERNSVATDRLSLVSQELAAARVRASHAGQLASARGQVASLGAQLARLQAAQRAAAARRAAQLAAAQRQAAASSGQGSGSSGSGSGGGGGGGFPAPAPAASAPSSSGFTFPMPKGDASPPSTWSPDDGVDISAPGGTPLYAVCSGTIVLHGIGGFGPSAPVLHCDSSLAGYDYVYYGHAGPGNWTPIGAHVSAGQVISEVGSGIVGISSGPHLELGFADSSGNPIGPGSAGTMMSLLQGSY